MDDPASLFLLVAADTDTVAEFPTLLSTTAYILGVLLLVLAHGFFVASEFALVAVRKSRIEAIAAEGDKRAERLMGMLNNLSSYISATQLGITLSSLGLGWVGEPDEYETAGFHHPGLGERCAKQFVGQVASLPVR